MTAEALTRQGNPGELKITAPEALTCGEVLQLPDGRAAVYTGLRAMASGDTVTVCVEGAFDVLKTASIVLLAGVKVYWDRSASSATFKKENGDFFLGTCVADAAAGDSTVRVALNVQPTGQINLGEGLWTDTAVNGGSTSRLTGAGYSLVLDATNEAQKADLISVEGMLVTQPGILAFRAKIAAASTSAVDVSMGIASGTHASDADAIAESVFFHADGGSTNILAESDDGTTEVGATDTAADYSTSVYQTFWIDLRDLTNVKLYIDGVRVLSDTTFAIGAASGPLYPLIHVEKSSSTATAQVDVEELQLLVTDLAA